MLEQIDEVSLLLEEYRPLLTRKKHRNKGEMLAQMKMKQVMKQSQEQIFVGLDSIFNTTGSQILKSLVDKRIITIHDYGYDDFEADELIGGYFGRLINVTKK